MSLSEFLAWASGDPTGRTWQPLDGEPLAMAPGNHTHAALQRDISRLVGNHPVERHSSSRAPTNPGLGPLADASRNYRVHDLGVICAPPFDSPILPDPVLPAEIASPGNRKTARGTVQACITLSRVQEILVVHGGRQEVELLRRRPDGHGPEDPHILGPEDRLGPASIDPEVAVADLYRPTVLAVAG
jgi:Uma2 family endonuclease